MTTPYRQSRTRGFSPWFQGPQSDQHIRVSDAERQVVTDRLAEHFAEGRLDQAEFDERVGRAMSAKTHADLGGLFADLPETGAPARPEQPRRNHRHRHPVLLVGLIVVIALAAGHVMMPLLWIGFLAAIVLLATGTIGRSRSTQNR